MRSPWMVVCGVAFAVVLPACGDNDLRIPDEPDDPFPGVLVRPSEFPHTNCGSHSLDGLIVPSVYTSRYDINLRIAPSDARGDGIATYMFSDDVETPHLRTSSDLLIRTEYDYGDPSVHILYAYNICGVDDDGTLHGSVGIAVIYPGKPVDTLPPSEAPMFTDEVYPPLLRIAGEPLTDHFSLLGESHGTWSGATSLDVKVDGDIAYLANGPDGLRLISVADPSHPVELGHYASGTDYANDVAVVHAAGRTYAVLADDIARIVDVTDPTNPIEVAELDVRPHTVAVEGTRAYFATAVDGVVPVYDLSDPTRPVKLGGWSGTSSSTPEPEYIGYHDLYVTNGIAYLSAYTGQGLDVVDLTDPTRPVEIAVQDEEDGRVYWHCPWASTLGTRKLAFDGDEGGGAGLRIFNDDATLADTEPLATWKLRDNRVSIHNVMVFGNRVYMTHYQDGVRVLDISVPEQPTQVGYYNTWVEGSSPGQYFAGAIGLDVDLARKRIYVADLARGLMILQGDSTVFPN